MAREDLDAQVLETIDWDVFFSSYKWASSLINPASNSLFL